MYICKSVSIRRCFNFYSDRHHRFVLIARFQLNLVHRQLDRDSLTAKMLLMRKDRQYKISLQIFTLFCSICFCSSRARRSFNFKENIATDLARLMRLCLTRDFFAANSAAENQIEWIF